MLTVNTTHVFGQAVEQIPGFAAANELRAFIARLRAGMTPTGEEPSVFDPSDIVAQQIHVLGVDVDRPDAAAIVVTQAERDHVKEAILGVIAAIQGSQPKLDINRTLISENARPDTALFQTPVVTWITQAENLLRLYEQFVFSPPTRERVSGLAIAGGLFLGFAALGAITYAISQQAKKGRRGKGRRR